MCVQFHCVGGKWFMLYLRTYVPGAAWSYSGQPIPPVEYTEEEVKTWWVWYVYMRSVPGMEWPLGTVQVLPFWCLVLYSLAILLLLRCKWCCSCWCVVLWLVASACMQAPTGGGKCCHHPHWTVYVCTYCMYMLPRQLPTLQNIRKWLLHRANLLATLAFTVTCESCLEIAYFTVMYCRCVRMVKKFCFFVFDGIMENCTHVCRICVFGVYLYVGASLGYLGRSNEAIGHSQTNLVVVNVKACTCFSLPWSLPLSGVGTCSK